MKKSLWSLSDVWVGFFRFLRSHLSVGLITAAILALAYARQAFSTYFYIDADILNSPESMYNWGDIGRYGLIWIKRLLGLAWFNPYFAGVLLLITLWLTAMGTCWLFRMMDDRISDACLCLFGLLYLVYPTFCEQFLFQFQAFEVVFAMLLLVIADCYLVRFLRNPDCCGFVISVVLTILSFGVYQCTASIELCLYCGIFLFGLYRTGEDGALIKRTVLSFVSHFGISFAGYWFISRTFYTGSQYLSGQVRWGKDTLYNILRAIYHYGLQILRGSDAYYTLSYTVFGCLFAAVMVLVVMEKKRRCVWYVLAALGIGVSPLFMSFVMGMGIAPRIQLTLPLAGAVMWLFAVHYLSLNSKRLKLSTAGKVLLTAAGVIFLYINASHVLRLFYSHDVIARADDITATQIMDDLDDYCSVFQGKSVIFIGHLPERMNGSCYTTDEASSYMIVSAFAMDWVFDPKYYYSSHRIKGYFRTLGFEQYTGPTPDMMSSAYEDSKDMAVWPLEGSIREFDDYIIVKLSDE